MKTNIIKFTPKNSLLSPMAMEYANKLKNETISTRFLGMQINNHLNWKKHIDQILPKLSTACFLSRRLFHIPNIDVLRMVYFAYFHSIIKYGLII